MAVDMRSVFSSHIDAIGYDAESAEFHVRYKSGRTSIYSGVSEDDAGSIMSAPSSGEAVHATLRGKYGHRYG